MQKFVVLKVYGSGRHLETNEGPYHKNT